MANSFNKKRFFSNALGDFLVDFLEGLILLAIVSGIIGDWLTGWQFFRYLYMIPIMAIFAPIIVVFLGSFIIYCFLCLIPWRKNKAFFMFEEDGLSPLSALIWLIVIFVFLRQTVPILLRNLGVALGILRGKVISMGANLDQTTIWVCLRPG